VFEQCLYIIEIVLLILTWYGHSAPMVRRRPLKMARRNWRSQKAMINP